MRLYISGLMFYFLLLLYLPLVLLGLWWLARRLRRRWLPDRPGVRATLLAGYVLAAVLVPLWDVFYTSWQMARLCPQAGLQVYRSVEVEGFYSEVAMLPREELEHGYRYVEQAARRHQLVRTARGADGFVEQRCTTDVPGCLPISRYWLTETLHQPVSRTVYWNEFAVRDNETGEVLGRSRVYVALPGWVDRWLLQMFDPVVWPCGKRERRALLQGVLLPTSSG